MLILASGSKRRIDLLKDAGFTFNVIPSNVSEEIDNNLTDSQNAMNIATNKALDVYNKHQDKIVLAADTIVVLNGTVFGKPKDNEEAFSMLKQLSNKTHDVITWVCIINNGEKEVFFSKSSVKIKDLSDEEINAYIETGEPFGKAGAYAIQGIGKSIVDTYSGDFFTIVGLPLKEVVDRLNKYIK